MYVMAVTNMLKKFYWDGALTEKSIKRR